MQVDETEIKYAVFSIGNDVSPGPDGFNSVFYKQHWDDVKHTLTQAVQNVLKTGKIVR